MTAEWCPVPLTLDVDLEHGGRWTSLRTPDREWLWTNPDPQAAAARPGASPGAAFVDAGGVEECLPTIRGVPDHGDAWTRSWAGTADESEVELPGLGVLERRISRGSELRVEYRLTAPPGTPYLQAVHALLDLSPAARVVVPAAESMVVLDVEDAHRRWPGGLDRLGPDDGSAICALLPDCHDATVIDGDHALRLRWDAPGRSELCSLLLWRNLGGWPKPRPYRSIGIEPMIGRAAELASADPSDCVRIDLSGHLDWTLSLTAFDRTSPTTDRHTPERTLAR